MKNDNQNECASDDFACISRRRPIQIFVNVRFAISETNLIIIFLWKLFAFFFFVKNW